MGISTGSLCLMTCSPIYLPYIMTSDRKLSKSLLAVGEISLGRFVSYLAFGALAGLAGANIAAIDRNFYGSIANILLAVYLMLTVLRSQRSDKKCHVPAIANLTKSGLLLGILTGINFCPAFLIALSEAVNLGGMLSGILLFMGFFVGTTLYLIPLAFASLLTQIKKMKDIARILSLIIAIWFIYKGASGLVEHYQAPKPEETRIIDVFHPDNQIVVVASEENREYFSELKKYIIQESGLTAEFILYSENVSDSLLSSNSIIFLDHNIEPDLNLKKHDIISVQSGYDIRSMTNWLKKFTFQSVEPLFWEFKPQQ